MHNKDLEFRFYHHRLGSIGYFNGEMHASIYEIHFDDEIKKSNNPFILQLMNSLIGEDNQSDHVQNHIKRGINIGNDDHTRIIASPNYPVTSYQPGYLISKLIRHGISGGDTSLFEPNIMREKYHYFWESSSPFSQWYKSDFTSEGIRFTSTEQYMMYKKAKLFGDESAAIKILSIDNPKEQKAIGRTVKGFDKNKWNQEATKIVYEGNYHKFTQNKKLQEYLIGTKGMTLVEASPYDKIWGIGLLKSDRKSNEIKYWKGKNWLGIVLTELRENILENSSGIGYFEYSELKEKRYHRIR